MHGLKQHIVFRISTMLLVATLFTPTAIKVAHIFEHHEHVLCAGGDDTHIHKVDLDCEFQKFQINNHFLTPQDFGDWVQITHHHKTQILTYRFLDNHRQLSFSLRGPPVLV